MNRDQLYIDLMAQGNTTGQDHQSSLLSIHQQQVSLNYIKEVNIKRFKIQLKEERRVHEAELHDPTKIVIPWNFHQLAI